MTKSRSNATAPNAKGTLVVGTGTDASTTLAVASTAGWLLSVDSAETTGLKWAAPASGALTKITKATFSSISSGSIADCFSATYDNYLIVFSDWVNAIGDANLIFYLRSGSTNQTSNYDGNIAYINNGSIAATTITTRLISFFHSNTGRCGGFIYVNNPYRSIPTTATFIGTGDNYPSFGGNVHTTSASYPSIGISVDASTSSGEVTVYGFQI